MNASPLHPAYRVVPVGDAMLSLEFENRIDPDINRLVIAVADVLEGQAFPGVRDVVPAYRTVAIHFDPLRTDYDRLIERLQPPEVEVPAEAAGSSTPPIRVPVCYEAEFAPDLSAVASFAGLTEGDVIRLHTAPTYRVFMLGFSPGFPYMGVVDQRIAAPRRPTPRLRVACGSVGIAGGQTGIYPAETPGGWQVIGRTPLRPFDRRKPEPFLFAAGDSVTFCAIDRAEFDRIERLQ